MDVLSWAQSAEVGQRVVYAKRTVADIEYQCERKGLPSAMRAHQQGLVFLAQRRTDDGFDYEATRISPVAAKKLGLLSEKKHVGTANPLASTLNDGWSEADIKILSDDHKHRLPASYTAAKLGKTRHAVLGKRQRMGLTG